MRLYTNRNEVWGVLLTDKRARSILSYAHFRNLICDAAGAEGICDCQLPTYKCDHIQVHSFDFSCKY